MSKATKFRIAIAFALALVAVVTYVMLPTSLERRSGVVSQGSFGGPFSLLDHNGQTVTDKDFRGAYMLIYFGYTSCPDVCPLDLRFMTGALNELGDDGDRVQPILITVDPLRDTPAVLADYVAAFHPRLVGLTGTTEQIAAVAKSYGVFREKEGEAADPAAAYLVNHTAVTILIGPDGEFVRVFSHGSGSGEIAAGLREIL